MREELDRFSEELQALIDKYSRTPQDDRLTVGEVIGALECKKYELLVVEYGE